MFRCVLMHIMVCLDLISRTSWESSSAKVCVICLRVLKTRQHMLSAHLLSAKGRDMSLSYLWENAKDKSWNQKVKTCLGGIPFFSLLVTNKLSLKCQWKRKIKSAIEEMLWL